MSAPGSQVGGPGAGDARRGRVVMLVDNTVRNDSRVQKQARSMAEAGWDVTLIGRAPGQKAERFKLGEAKVRLLPVSNALTGRRYMLRSGLTRGSLGYKSLRVASFRERQVEAKKYDARFRRSVWRQEAAEGKRSPLSLRLGEGWTKAYLAGALVEGRWVKVRGEATRKLTEGPTRLKSPAGEWWTKSLQRAMGNRVWRLMDPHLWDFEFAFAEAIDRLEPDIIHANDFAMIGVGARAAIRARGAGRRVKLVYDAHEFLPGINATTRHPWWHPAQVAYEREFLPFADAVVTVSETLADMLVEEHGLAERPAVVMNAPLVADSVDDSVPDLREQCGLSRDTPLLVYSGAMSAARGVPTMVEALPLLEGVHVAFIVSTTETKFVKELMEQAVRLGVRDRVHFHPYVAPEHVVQYVAPADIGVHPTLHFVNHEISLATKFFEYAHARLPIVVSDVKTMSEMVRGTGQGEVFRAGDVQDYVRAVRTVLADPERYRAAYAKPGLLGEWTWEKQAEVLGGVYDRLLRELEGERRD